MVAFDFISHTTEPMADDLAPPPNVRPGRRPSAWRVHRDGTGRLALKLTHGTGVWGADGALLWFLPKGGDLAWIEGGRTLLSLENTFGTCTLGGRQGVRHKLEKLAADTFQPRASLDLCVVSGGVQYLVVAPGGKRAVVTWSEQSAWGYVTVELDPLRQAGPALTWRAATLPPPAFSPDGRFVVACPARDTHWWAASDDGDPPFFSDGGRKCMAIITVQDMQSGDVTEHEIWITLPPGWTPQQQDRSEWYGLWGPDFIAADQLRVWLPDDTPSVLPFPLPPRIDLSHRLADRRSD